MTVTCHAVANAALRVFAGLTVLVFDHRTSHYLRGEPALALPPGRRGHERRPERGRAGAVVERRAALGCLGRRTSSACTSR